MASSTWTGKDQLQRCHAVPLSALNVSSRRIIGEHLNPVIYSQHVVNGIQQDWAGLAELIGFQYNEIQTMLEAKTVKALSSWTTKKGATIGKLLKHLETMERFDLLENTHFQQAVCKSHVFSLVWYALYVCSTVACTVDHSLTCFRPPGKWGDPTCMCAPYIDLYLYSYVLRVNKLLLLLLCSKTKSKRYLLELTTKWC